MLRIVAAVECGDTGRAKVQPLREVRGQHNRAQVWVLGQEPKGDHEVGLAAAHGLGQLESGLVGVSGEAQQALAEQGVHALGDVVAGKELRPVPRVADQIREIFDRLGHPVVVDHRMDLAGVTNGSEHVKLLFFYAHTFFVLPVAPL